jgi:alanyl-tRNA synthetase
MNIKSDQIRQKYLDFFKSKNHAIIPSASVVPENDPTVLFNTA